MGYQDYQPYNIHATGRELLLDDNVINLSFLRLVGATDGVEFIIETLTSYEQLKKLAEQCRKAAEAFYTEYIQSVGVRISVSVDEVRG